jgi:hypothetical protein
MAETVIYMTESKLQIMDFKIISYKNKEVSFK